MTHPGSPEHPAGGTACGNAAAEPARAGQHDRAHFGDRGDASHRARVRDRTYVAPGLRRAVSVGYLLRAVWTAIAAGALIHTAAAGPIVDPLGSPWLQAAIVLATLDLVVYLGILAAERLRPALGTGWLETPLVTIILAVATLAPGSINMTSPGATIFIMVWLVGLTGYTLVGHLVILRLHRRHQPPPLPEA